MEARQLRDGTELNIDYHLIMAFQCLSQKFLEIKFPDATYEPTQDELVQEFLEIFNQNFIGGDEYVAQVLALKKVLGNVNIYCAAILYLREAVIARQQGHIDLAWSYLTDSLYMAGFHNGIDGSLSTSYLDRKVKVDITSDLSLIEEEFNKIFQVKKGSKGGEHKSKNFQEKVVDRIFSLLEERIPPVHGWQSADSAAQDLVDYVQTIKKDDLLPWPKNRSVRSISNVIRNNKDRFNRINQKLQFPEES